VEICFSPLRSKGRIARDQLDQAGVYSTLRRYLDDPPSKAGLPAALTALGLESWDITRMSEPLAHELGLKDMADHNGGRVHPNRPVLDASRSSTCSDPRSSDGVSGRVGAEYTLVRPSKGV